MPTCGTTDSFRGIPGRYELTAVIADPNIRRDPADHAMAVVSSRLLCTPVLTKMDLMWS